VALRRPRPLCPTGPCNRARAQRRSPPPVSSSRAVARRRPPCSPGHSNVETFVGVPHASKVMVLTRGFFTVDSIAYRLGRLLTRTTLSTQTPLSTLMPFSTPTPLNSETSLDSITCLDSNASLDSNYSLDYSDASQFKNKNYNHILSHACKPMSIVICVVLFTVCLFTARALF
jgi:hypothetical protein